ncbi:MAG TPA: hypothetical protein VI752_01235 [Candidatus Paceibacterota bacterium]
MLKYKSDPLLNMYALTVIPIEQSIFKDELTYFSKNDIPTGSLVEVPIRKKQIKALVIDSTPASRIKSSLKSSDFALKKIHKVVTENWLSPFFLEAIKKTSTTFAVPIGSLLKATTPSIVLKDSTDHKLEPPQPIPGSENSHDIFALQETYEERISLYRGVVREEFAKHKSVIICTPTAIDAERIFESVSRGIENFAIILHNGLKEQELIDKWYTAANSAHPLLIVTTPLFLSLPKTNIGTFIIEQEGSADYYTLRRPFVDMRVLCEFYAYFSKSKLIFGDTNLRIETIKKAQDKDILTAAPLQYRILPHIETKVIDMHTKIDAGGDEAKNDFVLLGPDALKILDNIAKKNSRGVFLVGRKGLAPITVCSDCNSVVSCLDCKRPLTLHSQKQDNNIYICHSCQMIYKNTDTCSNCGGWRLTTLGIGTETVYSFIKKNYPDLNIFTIDSSITTTKKQVLSTINKFLDTHKSILIGTDMILRYLKTPIPYTGVISLDILFALPDFRMRENILRKLMQLKELTSEKMIIQTRLPKEKTFSYITSGNLADFYRDELTEREHFNYPPFSILIKITREGAGDIVQKDIEKLNQLFTDYFPVSFSGTTSTSKDTITMHTLLKVEKNSWPDDNIVEVLKSLPPRFIISVNPISIL